MTKASKFRFPSERPALDFLATLGARGTVEKNEKLRTAHDLADWVIEAKLVDNRPAGFTEDDLAAARQLREVIHRLASARLSAASQATTEEDVALLNGVAACAPPIPRLNANG